jgi:hypothetical protein
LNELTLDASATGSGKGEFGSGLKGVTREAVDVGSGKLSDESGATGGPATRSAWVSGISAAVL